jgi:16S rRNA (guanine527-N7)-methyltransferase
MTELPDHPRNALEFAGVCRKNGLALDEPGLARLERYAELLREWNARVNLVSRRDTENLWSAHLLHSLSILFVAGLPAEANVMDLGSGGGLPGIPLAIVRPDLRLMLVDSIAKKTAALSAMVAELGLPNIQVVCGRAEQLGAAHERKYGVVIARAVAALEDLLKWSEKLYDRGVPGGPMLVAFKGGDLEEELAHVKARVKGAEVRVVPLVFPGSAEAGLEGKKIVVVRIH